MTITEAMATWRLAYARACRHDGIEPTAKFAVFSTDNPHIAEVNQGAEQYFALLADTVGTSSPSSVLRDALEVAWTHVSRSIEIAEQDDEDASSMEDELKLIEAAQTILGAGR